MAGGFSPTEQAPKDSDRIPVVPGRADGKSMGFEELVDMPFADLLGPAAAPDDELLDSFDCAAAAGLAAPGGIQVQLVA